MPFAPTSSLPVQPQTKDQSLEVQGRTARVRSACVAGPEETEGEQAVTGWKNQASTKPGTSIRASALNVRAECIPQEVLEVNLRLSVAPLV